MKKCQTCSMVEEGSADITCWRPECPRTFVEDLTLEEKVAKVIDSQQRDAERCRALRHRPKNPEWLRLYRKEWQRRNRAGEPTRGTIHIDLPSRLA